jgi:hypothetical protein
VESKQKKQKLLSLTFLEKILPISNSKSEKEKSKSFGTYGSIKI